MRGIVKGGLNDADVFTGYELDPYVMQFISNNIFPNAAYSRKLLVTKNRIVGLRAGSSASGNIMIYDRTYNLISSEDWTAAPYYGHVVSDIFLPIAGYKEFIVKNYTTQHIRFFDENGTMTSYLQGGGDPQLFMSNATSKNRIFKWDLHTSATDNEVRRYDRRTGTYLGSTTIPTWTTTRRIMLPLEKGVLIIRLNPSGPYWYMSFVNEDGILSTWHQGWLSSLDPLNYIIF